MGVALSTPNFHPRTDGLLLPNEIIYKIADNFTPREILWIRGVCQTWLEFISDNKTLLVGEKFGINCTGSEYILQLLATTPPEVEEHLPLTISSFFLEDVELTRQSLRFWNLYAQTITRLEFTDCAVLPRIVVSSKDVDGRVVNMDTNYHLGCPNLKRLALKNMDKSFMMGGEFLQFHQILCLENLESLDVSCNKYLTDRILFDLLMKTTRLKSLNLSECCLILAKAVHNRFYPQWGDNYDTTSHSNGFSNHILSFQKLVEDFLLREKGSGLRELILKATPLTSYTANLIVDNEHFCWESLDVSYCRELKARDIFQLVSSHSKTLKKLYLNSDGRGPDSRNALLQIPLPQLEHLAIRNCQFILDDCSFLGNMTKLKTLKCPKISGTPSPEIKLALLSSLSKLISLTVLIVSDCAGIVDDNFLQTVIRTMHSLKKLNVSGCMQLTDKGFVGISDPIPKESVNFSNILPHWLLSQGVYCQCQNHIQLHKEPELEITIKEQAFPRLLNPEELNKTGNCLAELKYLEELDLSYCANLSSPTWHFALQLPKLHSLKLSGCELLSLNSMAVICQNCQNLEYLEVLRCTQLLAQPQFQDYLRKVLKRIKRFVV